MCIVPDSVPQQTPDVTRDLLVKNGVSADVCLVGERGYYLNTFHEKSNGRSVYDDAMFLVSPNGFWAFNLNTDPTPEFQNSVATLDLGVWKFSPSIHGKSKPPDQQYPCLEQCEPVRVIRDGTGIDNGMFAIQIHRGGYNSTSSLGCQTIYPDQWDSFISKVLKEMFAACQKTIPYLLLEKQG